MDENEKIDLLKSLRRLENRLWCVVQANGFKKQETNFNKLVALAIKIVLPRLLKIPESAAIDMRVFNLIVKPVVDAEINEEAADAITSLVLLHGMEAKISIGQFSKADILCLMTISNIGWERGTDTPSTISSEVVDSIIKQFKSSHGLRAANAKHEITKKRKVQAFEWFNANRAKYKTMPDTATAAKDALPISFDTALKYLREWKKQGAASKA
jgi:hypothetical protein